MKIRQMSAIFLAAVLPLATLPVRAFPQSKSSNAVGNVLFEVVGQSTIPAPNQSQAIYGYFTYVNAISGEEPIFNPGPQNETTALLTFYMDTVVERVINNGPIRIINRVGTMTIYLDSAPNGDFTNPNSFRDGIPGQTSEIRLQFILDTLTGAFTVSMVNTITAGGFFPLGSHNFVLGKNGQKFRSTFIGHVNAAAPPAAHFAGFAVGDLKN